MICSPRLEAGDHGEQPQSPEVIVTSGLFVVLGDHMKAIKVLLLAALLAVPVAASAQTSPAGLWDAAVIVNGLEIPFRFEITGDGATVSGWFFNGNEKVLSTGGKFENGSLVLNFDH